MKFPPSVDRPDLTKLLEETLRHGMTPEDKATQRMNWVVGEMMIEHPEMSREEVIAILRTVVS